MATVHRPISSLCWWIGGLPSFVASVFRTSSNTGRHSFGPIVILPGLAWCAASDALVTLPSERGRRKEDG